MVLGRQAQVKLHHGVPALFVDGKPCPPFAYMSYLPQERFYRQIAGTGIHLYCFPAYLGDRGINPARKLGPFRPGIWKDENKFDFSSLHGDFDLLLRADPRALVIIRLNLDPPTWWEKKYREGCCRLPNGTTFRQCFASSLWQAETAQALRKVVQWLRGSAYAAHVIGIHVAGGGTEEWAYHYNHTFHDENPARQHAFRQWLKRKYRCRLAGLRAAWRKPGVNFTNAVPADIGGRFRPERWRAPEAEQYILDTFRFHNETMAKAIIRFCRVVKRASGGRLLTGAFYGYHFFLRDPRKGHFALAKLLACKALDYLSSPNAYQRVMGEDWPPMAAVASVQQHGKLWLAENDTRTSKTTLLKEQAPHICPKGGYASGVWLGPATLADSIALLTKDAARMLAGGYGGWWFDMWGGWFDAPQLLRVFRRTQQLAAQAMNIRPPPMAAQICVVADEELCFYDASYGKLCEEILSNRYTLARCGAPYDLLLLSDFQALAPGGYRVLWLLGPVQLSARQIKVVDQWHAAGRTVLWTHPHGTQVRRAGEPHQTTLVETRRWSASDLQALWKEADVHLYVESQDVLYAGRGWLMLHAVVGGTRAINFPFMARVRDAFRNRMLADQTRQLIIRLPPRSTTLLQVEAVRHAFLPGARGKDNADDAMSKGEITICRLS